MPLQQSPFPVPPVVSHGLPVHVQQFRPGQPVYHIKYGTGTITRLTDKSAAVVLDDDQHNIIGHSRQCKYRLTGLRHRPSTYSN